MNPAEYERGRLAKLVRLLDREDKRRQQQRSRREQLEADARAERSERYGKGVKRAVVCVSMDPPRPFESVSACAAWLGVRHPSLLAALRTPGRRCCKLEFRYADEQEREKCTQKNSSGPPPGELPRRAEKSLRSA
jgi:hypothetical protein